MNCDLCDKKIRITPTAKYKIAKDALLVYCKKCWKEREMIRDRFRGQIQKGIYLATN